MHRLLITGGTGYLGNALVRLAQEQGFLVAGTYYSQPPTFDVSFDVSWLPLDVRDHLAVEEGVDMFQPETIIHTVYRQNDPHLWDVTAQGAANVASAARLVGARLIHLSSDVIFDGERQGAYTEGDAPSPITDYGETKAAAERMVLDVCPDAVIVRTSLIYGFHPPDRHTRFVLDIADTRSNTRLFRDEYRCPVFVDDLAAALLELAHTPYQGVLNIAGSDVVSRYEFGRLLAETYGRDPDLLPHGLSSESGTRRPRNCALDIRTAQRLLQTPLRGVRAVLTHQQAGSIPSQ